MRSANFTDAHKHIAVFEEKRTHRSHSEKEERMTLKSKLTALWSDAFRFLIPRMLLLFSFLNKLLRSPHECEFIEFLFMCYNNKPFILRDSCYLVTGCF